MNEFKTPRFAFSAFFAITTTIANFTGIMSEAGYLTAIGFILGGWGFMKVTNRLGGKNGN
jgi:hypothetical protein